MLRIRSVRCLGERFVSLGLTDGTTRVLDLTPFMQGPIFQPLLDDDARFREVSVDRVRGTLVWPNGADLDPDVLLGLERPAAT